MAALNNLVVVIESNNGLLGHAYRTLSRGRVPAVGWDCVRTAEHDRDNYAKVGHGEDVQSVTAANNAGPSVTAIEFAGVDSAGRHSGCDQEQGALIMVAIDESRRAVVAERGVEVRAQSEAAQVEADERDADRAADIARAEEQRTTIDALRERRRAATRPLLRASTGWGTRY